METTRKQFTCEFEGAILGYIEGKANILGVSLEEMARFILGLWVEADMEQTRQMGPRLIPLMRMEQQPPIQPQPSVDSDMMAKLQSPEYRAMAMASQLLMQEQVKHGALKCPKCGIATITWEDLMVKDPKCNGCGLSIDPFEPQTRSGKEADGGV